MPETKELLFVYGTLLSADDGVAGRAQRARLGREARVISAARTPGRLYNLGRYPGLVLPAGPDEVVEGEVLELATPQTTLRWLDAYEGIVPGSHTHGDYERLRLDVTLADGCAASACR